MISYQLIISLSGNGSHFHTELWVDAMIYITRNWPYRVNPQVMAWIFFLKLGEIWFLSLKLQYLGNYTVLKIYFIILFQPIILVLSNCFV